MSERILELEEHLNHLLERIYLEGKPNQALLTAAKEWSKAVWATAEKETPLHLSSDIIEQAYHLSQNPIHICGVHRSGTTLVRDLLDEHPALCLLPSEGSFFTNTHQHLQKLPHTLWLSFLGCEWLKRLANPINQPPYWILGRSTDHHSPYVLFARAFMTFWTVVEKRFKSEVSQKPLLTTALAYCYSLGKGTIKPRVRFWGEKTPTNEKFLDKLWKEFPSAKIIHVVRHPFAVYASRKKLNERIKEPSFTARRTLRDMASSYRIAVEQNNNGEKYFLLKFEDLLKNPAEVMKRVAAFLEIEFVPTLLRPTVAGMPSLSNSSFTRSDERGKIFASSLLPHSDMLTETEQELIAAAVGNYANVIGYDIPPLSKGKSLYLKILHAIE